MNRQSQEQLMMRWAWPYTKQSTVLRTWIPGRDPPLI